MLKSLEQCTNIAFREIFDIEDLLVKALNFSLDYFWNLLGIGV